jgi:hypothetical protein
LTAGEGSQVYVEGNVSSKHPSADPWELVGAATANGQVSGKDLPAEVKAGAPFASPAVTTVPAARVPEHVLATAGALPRDETDRRLVREFLTGTGKCGAPDRTHNSPIPAPQSGTPLADADSDGMPDAWERAHGLDPNDAADGPRDKDRDGYTNLEEYLNEVAASLESLEKHARADG